MKFEIEIDEKLFRGWEPVAFRVPKDGEYFAQISDDNKNMIMLKADRVEFGRLIIKPPKERKFRLVGHNGKSCIPKPGQFYSTYNALIKYDNNEFYPDNAEIWEEIYD